MDSQQNGSGSHSTVSVEAANKDLAIRMMERLNEGDVDGNVSFFAETVINHGFTVDRAIIRCILQDIKDTFPDVRFDPLQVTAEGEWVTYRARFSGTHTGTSRLAVNGGIMVGVPPTGKSISVDHIHVFRFRDGAVQEHYACRDDLEMARQLGLLPPAPPFDPSAALQERQAAVTERVHANAP